MYNIICKWQTAGLRVILATERWEREKKERRKCRVRLYYYLITFIDYGVLHCARLLLCLFRGKRSVEEEDSRFNTRNGILFVPGSELWVML